MALLMQEALKRSQNPMMRGILKSIVTTDELGALISMEPIDGHAVPLDREGTLPTTEFVGDAGTTTEESSGTDDVPAVQMRRIVGNLDVDSLAEGVGGLSAQARRNRLVGKKAKATWRLVKEKLISGGHTTSHTFSTDISAAVTAIDYGPHLDSSRRGPGSLRYSHSTTTWEFRAPGEITYGEGVVVDTDATVTLKGHNPSNYIKATIDVSEIVADAEVLVYFASSNNEFDGLFEMVDPGMTVPVSGANGDTFDIEMLDELIDMVKIRESLAFLMNGKHIIRYLATNRSLGGADPRHMQLQGYGGQVISYRGIPLLTNDNIKTYAEGSGTVADIALVSLSPDEGLVLGAQTSGGPSRAFSVDADPRSRSVLGFRIEDLGPLEGKDARRIRVKWYGAPVLKSTLACAIRQGVVTTAQ